MTKVLALANFFCYSDRVAERLLPLVEEYRRDNTAFLEGRCAEIAVEVGHGVTTDDVQDMFRVIRAVVEEVEERKEEKETEKAIAMLDELQAINAV